VTTRSGASAIAKGQYMLLLIAIIVGIMGELHGHDDVGVRIFLAKTGKRLPF
jgi:hypothetical protein